ncbi:MAG: TonB family protein [Bacteroidetes bacterium]|nr:MAG: TonB family protein [Bacteroidota bacterium]
MKTMLMLMAFCVAALAAWGQSRNGDTTITYYDHEGKPTKPVNYTEIGASWLENGKWRQQRFTSGDYTLRSDAQYADKELTIKDGTFLRFHYNGMVMDSAVYVQNKLHGGNLSWYETGEPRADLHWNHGLPVDTAIWLERTGQVLAIQITDSSGSGQYQKFGDSNKLVRVKGRLYNGQKHGKWEYVDEQGVKSFEAVFAADSVVSAICFDAKGQPEPPSKDCMLEKPAGFPGGLSAWKSFLERSLQYPDDAVNARAQGVVRIEFTVGADGRAEGFKVLASPYPSLATEALRIMKSAKKWEAATQYNRKVAYRHIQAITFQLQ